MNAPEYNNSRLYLRATKEFFTQLPIPPPVIAKRGIPTRINEEGESVFIENPTFLDYVEWYPGTKGTIRWLIYNPPIQEVDAEGNTIAVHPQPPTDTTFENATMGIVGVPNFSQKELKSILQIGEAVATAGFAFILSHQEVLNFIVNGTEPEA